MGSVAIDPSNPSTIWVGSGEDVGGRHVGFGNGMYVSYDGGGLVRVAEDTNDIGLRAIELMEPPEGHPLRGKVSAGVWFQVLLGGVTGHQEFAEDSGVLCHPNDATDLVGALVRVYIRNGNRSNRGKSRLIYLLKDWGVDRYLRLKELRIEPGPGAHQQFIPVEDVDLGANRILISQHPGVAIEVVDTTVYR